MRKNGIIKAGAKKHNAPRLVGEILHAFFDNNESLPFPEVVASAGANNDLPFCEWEDGYNRNTELGVDVKSMLRSSRTLIINKVYEGTLVKDGSDHLLFTETAPQEKVTRNQKVFNGKRITMTRRPDGTVRLNFKSFKIEKGFSVLGFAIEVGKEVIMALRTIII